MKKLKLWPIIVVALVLLNLYVWNEAKAGSGDYLSVSFLDIGQGDSLLIQAPNGVQMLIDGGRDERLLSELSSIMPLSDRTIDILMATHPDADHIGGLPSVLDEYQVANIVTNGETSNTQISKKFERESDNENSREIVGKQGMRIMLDAENNIYFDILWPRENMASDDTNSLSIVGRLVYGEREFLLTGDATLYSENEIMKFCRECLSADVLKAGHHGSRTSSGRSFLEAVSPSYAVISAGLNNSYGHPHREVVDRFKALGMNILETSKEGTITFETDGKRLWRK